MSSSRLPSIRPTTRRERLARERELKNQLGPKAPMVNIIRGMLLRVLVKGALLGLILALAYYLIK